MLPVEVVGEDGSTSDVAVDVPAQAAREVRSLWMEINGLGYPDMISVRVNSGAWSPLNNDTVVVAEPGRSYGGIGGGFSTLNVTLALPAGIVVEGTNVIHFRFNKTDGVASGFRVVAFNLLTADSRGVLPPDAFAQADPDTWMPPLRDPESLRAGKDVWLNASLTANGLAHAPSIRAHCADCHARDGRDLKYFAFSNESIVARSRFHGLSDLQGRQIASYIRSLPIPSPGRPWNPPYQPGPGLDAAPVADWAAGAGLSWVLDSDAATLPFIFAAGGEPRTRTASDVGVNAADRRGVNAVVTRTAFRPDGNLNPREIPISLQLPDWNHWLPRVHPLDAWGPAFQHSEFARAQEALRRALASPDLAALISTGRIAASFDKWTSARRAMLKPYVEGRGVNWSADLASKAYSTQLWQLVKTWEMTQEFGLEGRGLAQPGATGDSRTWLNTVPAATAPATVNIPDGPSGMGGSGLTNEYFDASWYELQVILNSGSHRHRGRLPVDWIYLIGRFQDLYRETRRPEPARLLVTLIKAIQSTDPRIGPDDVAQGWRPGQNVDPTIMVNPAWAPVFQTLSAQEKRAITESFLAAWMEKNQQYPVSRYLRVGLSESSYALPSSYGTIAGGKVWESAPLFLEAGVSAELIGQLRKWGASYTDMATRFQYSPGSTSSGKATEHRKSGAH